MEMFRGYAQMNPEEKAEWNIEFTKIYQSFHEADIEAREAAILEHQFPSLFLLPEENDLVTGRLKEAPLVFTPQLNEGRAGFAYCFDPEKFQELKSQVSGIVLQNQLKAVEEFWLKNDSGQQTRLAYPQEVSKLLVSDKWTEEPGIGFPLLRMSGSQMDYSKLIELGIPGLENEIRSKCAKMPESAKLFKGMLHALQVLKNVIQFNERGVRDHLGRVKTLEKSIHLKHLADALANIQNSAPSSLLEGIQLFYLYNLSSGSNNFGRMDDYLGPLYYKDTAAGRINRDEAVSYFVHLWKLVNFKNILWDGRVIIGGKGRRNPKLADELALVIIDSVGISADILPQLTLRMYDGMDEGLKVRSYDIIAQGNPYPLIYNDEVNIPSAMSAFNTDEKTAEDCVPFGCGEYVLYGKSYGTPSGVINLLKALEVSINQGYDLIENRMLGVEKANSIQIDTFDDLWKAYTINMQAYIHALALQEKIEYEVAGKAAPFLFQSILFDDCVSRGKALFGGGIRHLGGTLETYGNTNTADSLVAIRNLVFEQKKISWNELLDTLKNNFKNHSNIRKMLLEQPKYGNDNDEADEMLIKVHDHVCLATRAEAEKVGLDSYLVVNINNSANTTLGKYTAASADGRLAFTSLANGNTPNMGMDKQGATALLNSISKPSTSYDAGASQNFKISREMLVKYRMQTVAMFDTYFRKGGAQLMITAVNKGDLEMAMQHPEEYPNLLVRVGGFSARFVELDKDIQMEILNRTLY